MSYKSKIKDILSIVALILIMVIILNGCVHFVGKSIYVTPYKADDFKKYKSDFKTLAEYMYDNFSRKLNDEEISYIKVEEGVEEIRVTYVYKDKEKEDTVYTQAIDKKLQDCFLSIRLVLGPDSEGRGSFTGIYITKEQVAFVRLGDHYALVYSKKKRPKFIIPENEKCFVDRISLFWYQVTDKTQAPTKPV